MENKEIVQEVIKEMKELDTKCSKYKETEESRETKEYEIKRIEGYYNHMPTILQKNKDIALEAIKSENISYMEMPQQEFLNDKEIAIALILKDWENAAEFEEMIDRDFTLELAKEADKDGTWLGYASEPNSVPAQLLKNDPDAFLDNDYMRKLLQYDGTAVFLRNSTDEIKNDKELVLHVLKNNTIADFTLYKSIGDTLFRDSDVQKAFAEALIRENYGDEEAVGFTYDMYHMYEDLSDDKKEFVKQVVSSDGFIDKVLEEDRSSETKEMLLSLLEKIKQHDLPNVKEISHGASR